MAAKDKLTTIQQYSKSRGINEQKLYTLLRTNRGKPHRIQSGPGCKLMVRKSSWPFFDAQLKVKKNKKAKSLPNIDFDIEAAITLFEEIGLKAGLATEERLLVSDDHNCLEFEGTEFDLALDLLVDAIYDKLEAS